MLVSVLLHLAAIVLLVLLSPAPVNIPAAKDRPARYRILLQPIPTPSKGRGGGGSDSITPPSRGQLPRYARRQFTPPTPVIHNPDPKLAVEPTIVLASATNVQQLPDMPIGLPNGILGPPSGGRGKRGGLGNGEDGGIGDGNGPSIEGMKIEQLRAGIKPPVLVYKLEPEYSEMARKARVQGTVCVEAIIDGNGQVRGLRIRDGLGYGLDEQALEAVKQWRFRPATLDGKPVAIVGAFYLTFRLL
jgi:periplasmic protein TonB